MEIKEFVKSVLVDIDKAITEASAETAREIRFSSNNVNRVVEFDIAVSAENEKSGGAGASIKVVSLVNIDGGGNAKEKVSHVSRITFGVSINSHTRQEIGEYEKRRQQDIKSFTSSCK